MQPSVAVAKPKTSAPIERRDRDRDRDRDRERDRVLVGRRGRSSLPEPGLVVASPATVVPPFANEILASPTEGPPPVEAYHS